MPLFMRQFAAFCIALTCCSALSAAELTMAVVGYPSPDPKEPLVEATIKHLQRQKHRVHVIRIHFTKLPQAIRDGKVDFFLSSPGLYRELVALGARDLATVCTSQYVDPNRAEASAFVTLSSNRAIQDTSNLKGSRVAVKSLTGFVSYYVPIWEIFHKGFDIDNFFGHKVVVDARDFGDRALQLLRDKEVDVVFLKHCLLEDRLTSHPEENGFYKVLDEVQQPGECKRSTRLYPSWVLATSKALPGDVTRDILQTVLSVTASTANDTKLFWSIATDYSAVDSLYRDLKLGPYAYLKGWTVQRFFKTYWLWFALLFAGIIALLLQSMFVNRLVSKRTTALERALEKEKRLQREKMALSGRLERMQRIGALESFVSIFAHEMRQPIASIRFYLKTLEKLIDEQLADKRDISKILIRLENQVLRCNTIVERIRGYIRDVNKQHQEINFSDTVSNTVANFLATQIDSPAIDTQIESGIYVLGDRFELELMVLNLLRNAAEALNGINQGFICVSLASREGLAHLSISNNGRTLTDTEFSHLGEAFSSSKISGLGLGLPIVKAISEKHQATVVFKQIANGLVVCFSISIERKIP